MPSKKVKNSKPQFKILLVLSKESVIHCKHNRYQSSTDTTLLVLLMFGLAYMLN